MQIRYKKMSGMTEEILNLLNEADSIPELQGYVFPRLTKDIVIFYDDSKPIGFAIPRLELGYWRVGPIYVKPEYRGKKVAHDFLDEFYNDGDKPARALIEVNNHRSECLFVSLGFVKGKQIPYNGTIFNLYTRARHAE